MHRGEAGRIELLDTGDGGVVQRLVALGMLPGASVRLLRRVPAFVVQVDNTQIAMDETMAGRIQVRLNAA
jgi:Fe2+ transport system protein FeoA